MLLNEKSKRIIQVLMHENDVTLPLLTLMLPYSKRTIEDVEDDHWIRHHRSRGRCHHRRARHLWKDV